MKLKMFLAIRPVRQQFVFVALPPKAKEDKDFQQPDRA
jgi:hypothetical protein